MLFAQAQEIAPNIWLLPRYVDTSALVPLIDAVAAQAPFRHMTVPGGAQTKAALTNAGALGWGSNRFEYRYTAVDPNSGKAWPAIPTPLLVLGTQAAAACGFANFSPDACLFNRYVAGAGMGLHQDKNERDFTQPIVSVSMGAPCRFVIGGMERSAPTRSLILSDGDVMVWGGVSRLVFHGVRPLAAGSALRYNITLRKAG